MMEVDDMAARVIQGLPSSPTQITSFAKKVQTIIRRCMVSIGNPRRGGERGEGSGGHGRGDLGSSNHGDSFDSLDLDISSFSLGLSPPAQSHPGGLGTSYAPPPQGLWFSSFWSPHPSGLGFSSFQVPPPLGIVSSSFQAPPHPGTVGSSIPHMPISYASSSDSDEHDDERSDDVTPARQLGFGHRVGKKTTGFTPSDWP
ncbi:hypothetical protein M9H77_27429 [Catharanthus roseus]|uniref:Uncharacterized protein n=1 Tax=Catharanthus roseus TaxID=4058 RepID=A0ACC0AGL7_CATRO|nr:hypothetical protein M9H77_27429 [Catharanthus roseus]